MNLAIDIGNSRVKAGIFEKNNLKKTFVFDDIGKVDLNSILKDNPEISNSIVCSVKTCPIEWKDILSAKTNFRELSYLSLTNYHLPITISYQTPETLGMDRLASVCGAYSIYGDTNILVINAGTCITYDFIANSVYYGGSISPGINMRFKALHTFTGQLPLLQQDTKMKRITGLSTYEAIQAGVQQGVLNEVEKVIMNYTVLYRNLTVLLAGGSSSWILKQIENKLLNSLKIEIKAQPFLVLKGLNVILQTFVKL